MSQKRVIKKRIIFFVIAFVAIALFIEAAILNSNNNKHVNRTSKLVLDQVERIINENDLNEQELLEQLKEEYIERAKTVGYILQQNKIFIEDINELNNIANMMGIDEINIFDSNGVIYAGTIARYYGMSFEEGEQIAFFKPMLGDKNMTMCQDITPNTAEEKSMMYAIAWSSDGTFMTQVGIEPVRLLEELKNNQISEVVNQMPAYEGLEIIVADINTGEILGSSDNKVLGDTVYQVGLLSKNDNLQTIKNNSVTLKGYKNLCNYRQHGKYLIAVVHSTSVNVESFLIAIIIEFIYLIIAVGVFLIMLNRLVKGKIIEEKLTKKSNTDELTELLNRRAYEDDMINYPDIPPEEDFVYASIDINGLKVVNDNLGHVAGDEIIKGAAYVLKKTVGNYGRIYRIGGDEFVSIFFADEAHLEQVVKDLQYMASQWKGEMVDSLSFSIGYATKREFPIESKKKMAEVADKRMYEDKNRYYSSKGVDRRGQAAAHTALCNLYTKILKINLTTDQYSIVNMDITEQTIEKGFSENISTWLRNFGQSGQVHPDDIDEYMEKTDINYLREYFKQDKASISIFYRRKYEDGYKDVMMEMIPANDYTTENQSIFLYVKSIDK